jgi:hypothetical protein
VTEEIPEMKPKHLIIASILLFGSLWGLAELGLGEAALARGIPRAPLLTAGAVFFLVLMRRLWHVPGSSFALGALASSFKLLQHPVWGCKIAAVLMVGAIFDIGLSAFQARHMLAPGAPPPSLSLRTALVRAPVLTFVSFVLFGYVARYVLQNPYWADTARMLDYQFVQGAYAALLAVPAAFAGFKLALRLRAASDTWDAARALSYRVTAVCSGVAGIAVALALRY